MAPKRVECNGKTDLFRKEVVGAAARKEREPKITLVRRTCKRLEEEDDIRRREGRQVIRKQERQGGVSVCSL